MVQQSWRHGLIEPKHFAHRTQSLRGRLQPGSIGGKYFDRSIETTLAWWPDTVDNMVIYAQGASSWWSVLAYKNDHQLHFHLHQQPWLTDELIKTKFWRLKMPGFWPSWLLDIMCAFLHFHSLDPPCTISHFK